MSDILFRCEHCLQGLAIEDGYSGANLGCPYCTSIVTVPSTCTWFACASCGCELSAGHDTAGDVFGCPNCGIRLSVPENLTIRCKSCSIYLELNNEFRAEFGGQVVECPECGGEVSVPEAEKKATAGSELSKAGASIQQASPGEPSGELMQKTMKLDEILENIPQSRSIEKGNCPYCAQPLRSLQDNAYLCKRCNKVIRTVKQGARAAKSGRAK